MKSFLTSTRRYWQIRIEALTARVKYLLLLTLHLRQHSGVSKPRERVILKSYQDELATLRLARQVASASLKQIGRAV